MNNVFAHGIAFKRQKTKPSSVSSILQFYPVSPSRSVDGDSNNNGKCVHPFRVNLSMHRNIEIHMQPMARSLAVTLAFGLIDIIRWRVGERIRHDLVFGSNGPPRMSLFGFHQIHFSAIHVTLSAGFVIARSVASLTSEHEPILPALVKTVTVHRQSTHRERVASSERLKK